MAIAQPTALVAEYGQDLTWTVSLSPTEDVTGWTVSCTVRAYNGGTALITKTIGSGITVSDTGNGVFVVTLSASDLTLSTYGCGAYVIQLERTNSGFAYPITDPSPLILRPASSTAFGTLTNLGEYAAHALYGITLTDALAQQYIQLLFAAEDYVKRATGRQLVYGSYTEYPDGNGWPYFLVREPPITSITSLYLDTDAYYGQAANSYQAADLLTSGTDYYFAVDKADGLGHVGRVYRVGSIWPSRARFFYSSSNVAGLLNPLVEPMPGPIKITYMGGYPLVPYALKKAVWDLVTIGQEMALTGRWPTSEAGEGYSHSFGSMMDEAQLPMSVQNLIAMFRHGRTYIG